MPDKVTTINKILPILESDFVSGQRRCRYFRDLDAKTQDAIIEESRRAAFNWSQHLIKIINEKNIPQIHEALSSSLNKSSLKAFAVITGQKVPGNLLEVAEAIAALVGIEEYIRFLSRQSISTKKTKMLLHLTRMNKESTCDH